MILHLMPDTNQLLSPKAKWNISRIMPFGLIWLIFSLVYIQLEKGLLGNLNYYPSTGNPYNFTRNIFVTAIPAFITGLFIGTLEILYFNKLFVKRSLTQKIICKTIIYLAIIVSFLLTLSAIASSIELQTTIFNYKAWHYALTFFFSYAFLSVVIYIAAIIVVTQFYAEVSNNIGQGILNNFFTGKYHTPKEEERIFMFLDLKSSTTIAESLGHVRYFELLREYYADLSEPIINYSGEIYQYVGDEIIVSWKLKSGLQSNNCIHCFFAIKAAIKKQSSKYKERFGVLPEFKAGFHLGKVTTGEIGVIKKEIIFTGDVLNTTARIQGLCNIHKVEILISEALYQNLGPGPGFQIKTLGENELRGRDEKIELFTIIY